MGFSFDNARYLLLRDHRFHKGLVFPFAELLILNSFECRYIGNVVSCGINNESLKELKLPQSLKRLSLVDNSITDAGLASIRGECPKGLEELVLNLNYIKDIAKVSCLFDSLNIKIISDLQKYNCPLVKAKMCEFAVIILYG
jgi:hypothetical protein